MSKADSQAAGGKAANLGELTQAGFNVPAGCCVTSKSLAYHIEKNGMQGKIDTIAASFDYDAFEAMEKKTAEIRSLIEDSEIPANLLEEIQQTIESLTENGKHFVAVRSSVAVKDSPISSFPGMMDTYHYLKGMDEIILNVKKCWASLWTTRAVFNRFHKKIDHNLGLIAPVIQKMVSPNTAGVLFTANPITSSRDQLVIEANWGLGESVVSGKSMNDFYQLDKKTLDIQQAVIAKKTVMVSFNDEAGCGRKECAVDECDMQAPTLNEDQVHRLGEIGLKIESVFDYPQDIEWAFQENELFILQSRNIRNLKEEATA
ncbi:hypothetical protein DSCO28_65390 [Desulfosarcina ovata subsp. sediminis]|uniref:Phosphoenolpyruvate synthase n=2 Tax=Desulfosarcina ovata TaxID=83564 RepID=A0A5K8A0E6_9BACT|nr:hypothetical protein DSCO28_65390 [Desulfosarcina ovata subsp. sediminis]